MLGASKYIILTHGGKEHIGVKTKKFIGRRARVLIASNAGGYATVAVQDDMGLEQIVKYKSGH